MDQDDFSRPRINASTAHNFQGRKICVLGLAKNVDSSGTSFELTTSDGKDVKVIMPEPLNDYVSGLTEVLGQVDVRNNIRCERLVLFPEEATKAFDMELYNSARELTLKYPQHYIQGVNQ